ncbi:PREDICTED: F-box only protein 7-like isoform X2 [Priapulus caudatus]|uniref:F-box only protein 7-like isoform X2 n=1 Tax=Priapulus caudatus TaxID=37621 RepID=A0ABM1DRP3_PRICU|nr:PREDICTED: F-box only protein 7-like isoform X2 [Priapulus caudatus]
MRVRIRYGTITKPLVVDQPQSVTVASLRGLVNDLLQHEFNDVSLAHEKFDLSLNGIDPICEDETMLLGDLGIISGDLIKILPSESEQKCENLGIGIVEHHLPSMSDVDMVPEECKSETHAEYNVASKTEAQGTNECSCTQVECQSSDSDMPCGGSTAVLEKQIDEQTLIENEQIVNRYLREPMLVRDSYGNVIPHSLQMLLSSEDVETVTDAVCIVVHQLMLESGFFVKNCSNHHMPEDWKNRSSSYKINYQHPDTNQLICTLLIVPLNPRIMVMHGMVQPSIHYCTLKVDINSFVDSQADSIGSRHVGYKKLSKLSQMVKDILAYPLLIAMQQEEGVSIKSGLLGLVPEIKLLVLSYLDSSSLLKASEVSQELYSLSREQVLWKRLYMREFGRRHRVEPGSHDWLKLYKDEYIQRREERKAKHKRSSCYLHSRPRHPCLPPYPVGPSFPFPRIIGGDYDIHPFIPGLFPNSGVEDGMTSFPMLGHPLNRTTRGSRRVMPRFL